MARLPPAEVVVLGEVHDNPAHHANQAAAVAALAPAALVFEMLTPAQAGRVTPALRGDAAALGAALEWEASGWPDFAMYHPIFTAAPGAAVYGAAFGRAEVARAVREGAASVFGAEAARFGLDRALAPEDLAARLAEQAEAHCDALPAEMLPGMVEAQRLRDAGLARAALQALAETGGPVAVIAGNGHARTDRGMPWHLAVAAPEVTILAVGQFEAPPEEPAPPYDLWLVTPPAAREDPCAVFRGG
ncbi:MAG: ChaN family lipoprotein [Rhodobacteraceae bacterium]|nr:ChaN family lipoprotein [Paracoccaceae bacterium]